MEELARIVPVVNGLADVDTFVTLQANKLGVASLGNDFCKFCFTNASFTFKEKWTIQRERKKNRSRNTVVNEVVVSSECVAHFIGCPWDVGKIRH